MLDVVVVMVAVGVRFVGAAFEGWVCNATSNPAV